MSEVSLTQLSALLASASTYPSQTQSTDMSSFAALFASELTEAVEAQSVSVAADASTATDTDQTSETAATDVSSTLDSLLEGEDGISKLLLLFCSMLSTNGSGTSGGMGAMVSSLAAALSGVSNGEFESIRYDLLSNTDIDKEVLAQTNDTFFQSSASEAITPFRAGKAVTPSVTSDESNRSAARYRAVIDQFDVENNPRYMVNKNGNNDTYCNIFLWDVTLAMGAEIPHYVDRETGAPMSYPDVSGAKALNANAIYDWLKEKGSDYGWYQVSPEQAQEYANRGMPVVTAFKNLSGGHGHVQVVCPSTDGEYDAERGVTIAQAGRLLYNYAPITKIYNSSLSKVVYYAHR